MNDYTWLRAEMEYRREQIIRDYQTRSSTAQAPQAGAQHPTERRRRG